MRYAACVFLLALPLEATTFTVKTSGGDYSAIGTCMNAISAGDICEVYAGNWSGWTQSSSGSSGSPKTAQAHAGDTVNITSTNIALGGRSYIAIKNFTNISVSIFCTTDCDHITVEGNGMTGASAFYSADGSGRNSHDNIFRNNVVNVNSTSSAAAIYFYGNSNLFDANEIYNGGGDCFEGGGQNTVVRNNYCHDMDATVSGEHIDFWQTIGGGTTPTTFFALFEGNRFADCVDSTFNCHLGIHRQGGGLVGDTIQWRFNFAYNLDGSGVGYGGSGDDAPNGCFVHNTVHTLTLGTTNGECVSFQNASGGQVFNNICSQSMANGTSPTVSVGAANGNIAYNSGYSGTWNAPYSSEATYTSLRNQNPLYVDITAGPDIQSGSPAKDAAVKITSVATADTGTGTSLVVDNAHCFQPGWAGVNADVLLIGTSTTATVSSIDYSTNTITLTGSVSRNDGDAVTLYRRTDGTGVVDGTVRDIGAFEYQTPASGTGGRGGGSIKTGGNSKSGDE